MKEPTFDAIFNYIKEKVEDGSINKEILNDDYSQLLNRINYDMSNQFDYESFSELNNICTQFSTIIKSIALAKAQRHREFHDISIKQFQLFMKRVCAFVDSDCVESVRKENAH